MPLQTQTKGDFDTFTPKSTVTPQRKKPGHTYQKDNDVLNDLPQETTVLGTIQILCCLMISSMGVILVFAPYSSHFNPAVSNILMSGYSFVGALCFAISGSLSIISGEKSTKPFTLSSLTSNAVSSLTAGAGLFLLADGMVALGTAFQHCDSEKDYLSSLPSSEDYYPMYKAKDCLLSSASLTGVLAVMLTFTVLELLLTAYTSVFWWKRFYSNNPGVLQIMLGLIIIGFGMIFVFNFLIFSQGFPLVFLTGYPFWGALIFILTGYLTGIDEKSTKILGQGVMSMNVISSLVAVAGITLTIVTYRHQYNYCQRPSLEGICVFGTTLFVGILSVMLIISIAELSISVTIASFRSKCWVHSDEVVFFLPSDIPQDSEQPGPEQNAQLQFELQEGSFIDDTTMNLQPVFFGGYAFFKLRITRSSLASQPRSQSCNKSIYHTTSASVPEEQEQSIPPPSEEELLLPVLETRPSEHIMHIQEDLTFEQLKGEDLQPAIVKPSKMQTQLAQDQDLPLQVLPSHSVLKLQELSPEDLPAQALPVQDLPVQNKLSKFPSSHSIKSFDLTTEDLPTQYIPSQDASSQDTPFLDALSQNTPSQDMPSQDMLSQALSKAMLSEASTPNTEQFSDMKYLLQQSPDLQPQNIQPQNPELLQIPYKDIRSEVMEETTKWESKEELHRKKSSGRRHSLDQQTKGYHAPRRYSLDQQTRSWQSPKQKALDKQIRFLLSQQKQSLDKQNQYPQTPEQLPDQQYTDVHQAKRKQTPEGQFIAGQKKDHQAEKEQSPKKQTQDQQANDQQAQEEKSLKGQSQNFQVKGQQVQVKKAPSQLYQDQESQIQQQQDWQPPKKKFSECSTQDWQSFGPQQSQEWGTQSHRNKDWKAQEWQFEMQHSLNRDLQSSKTQDLLEKEALFKDSQCQDEDQKDFDLTVIQKKDMQVDCVQTRDITPEDVKSTGQTPKDLQSEDMKPDFQSSSCQSSVQDTRLGSLSNIDSEQDVQQNTSVSSNSCREDLNLTSSSYCPKDQQSEDSD